MNKESLKIRDAKKDDLDEVLLTQESVLLENKKDFKTETELKEEGFIKYEVSKRELQKILKDEQNHILLVAEDNEEIVGYALGYKISAWEDSKPKWRNKLQLNSTENNLLDKKGMYLRHIVVKKGRENEGIGTQLQSEFIKRCNNNNFEYILAEVMEQPILNKISVDFHKEFGYKNLGSIKYADDINWNIFIKKLN